MAQPNKISDIFVQWSAANIAEVSANQVLVSSELDVSSIFLAKFFIDFSPTGTGAITVGSELTIESTPFATGAAGWRPIISPFIFDVNTPNSSAVDGTEAIGSTVIEESVTTGLANNVRVFFKNASLQNSEWARIASIVGSTSFTVVDPITFAQTGSTWFNLAQYFTPLVDLSAVKRLRAVLNNNRHATARACAVRVGMVQLSSVE